MRYTGAPLHLPNKMKPRAVELKAHIWSQEQNYEELSELITSREASHACVFKSMDLMVHVDVILSIRTLT